MATSISHIIILRLLLSNIQKPKNSNNLTIYTANAGDARIVLGHSGIATRLTKDHRTDDPSEVQRIEKSGGFMFKGRVLGVLAVTRSLGDHCMKQYVVAQPFLKETSIELSHDTDEDSPSMLILVSLLPTNNKSMPW